ncbi:MAG: hypothetical protein WC320_00780 [Candidatus Paceibacterota bacterium]|jgi:hypothetical protein
MADKPASASTSAKASVDKKATVDKPASASTSAKASVDKKATVDKPAFAKATAGREESLVSFQSF